jgi:hypothetical protein
MKWTVTKPDGVVPIAVRFDLPYCLYLENGTYAVQVDGSPIQIETLKMWRNSQDSSDDDTVADQATYFKEGHVIGAPIGGEETTGLVGKNIEFAGDRVGFFRYTRMVIGLTYPADTPHQQKGSDIAHLAVSAANVLVDSYRYISGRAYIPRLRITDLRFMEIQYPLTGEIEYVGLFSQGLRIAVVNDGQTVHDEVRRMADAGEGVPIHADLLLAAIRAMWENDYRLAIIEAVSALEVFVDDRLFSSLVRFGEMTEEDFDQFMNDHGRVLSDRMKKPIRTVGLTSPADNQELWENWLAANSLRRDVVHAGYQVTEDEAKTVVRAVQELLEEMGDEGMHLAEEMPS